MSIFSASIQHRTYHWQMNSMCFVLGILIAASWQTATAVSRAGIASQRTGFYYPPSAVAQVQDEKEKLANLQTEIKTRGNDITILQNKLAQGTDASETLNKQLQEIKLQAGQTNVIGQGIEIALVDSRNKPTSPNDMINQSNLIHDTDVMTVVNELRAAGAEAISVNDQRVIATTAIRCVGPNVQVNGVPYASPFIIRAIGDPNALLGGLKTPGGVFEKIGLYDAAMIKADKKAELKLPAFGGNTQIRFAKSEAAPVKPSETKPTDTKSDLKSTQSDKTEDSNTKASDQKNSETKSLTDKNNDKNNDTSTETKTKDRDEKRNGQ